LLYWWEPQVNFFGFYLLSPKEQLIKETNNRKNEAHDAGHRFRQSGSSRPLSELVEKIDGSDHGRQFHHASLSFALDQQPSRLVQLGTVRRTYQRRLDHPFHGLAPLFVASSAGDRNCCERSVARLSVSAVIEARNVVRGELGIKPREVIGATDGGIQFEAKQGHHVLATGKTEVIMSFAGM